jgi:hypothetical protein
VTAAATAVLKFYEAHGWCQGAYARDAEGKQVAVTDPETRAIAVEFCLEGALYACGLSPAALDKDLPTKTALEFNERPGQTWELVRAELQRIAG